MGPGPLLRYSVPPRGRRASPVRTHPRRRRGATPVRPHPHQARPPSRRATPVPPRPPRPRSGPLSARRRLPLLYGVPPLRGQLPCCPCPFSGRPLPVGGRSPRLRARWCPRTSSTPSAWCAVLPRRRRNPHPQPPPPRLPPPRRSRPRPPCSASPWCVGSAGRRVRRVRKPVAGGRSSGRRSPRPPRPRPRGPRPRRPSPRPQQHRRRSRLRQRLRHPRTPLPSSVPARPHRRPRSRPPSRSARSAFPDRLPCSAR
ncbi:hypothetical protein SXANM310S_07123 [Streptomyces xanthochromogenes]